MGALFEALDEGILVADLKSTDQIFFYHFNFPRSAVKLIFASDLFGSRATVGVGVYFMRVKIHPLSHLYTCHSCKVNKKHTSQPKKPTYWDIVLLFATLQVILMQPCFCVCVVNDWMTHNVIRLWYHTKSPKRSWYRPEKGV